MEMKDRYRQGRTDYQGISDMPCPSGLEAAAPPPPQDSTHRLLTVPGIKKRLLSSSDGIPTVRNSAPLVMIRQEIAPLVSEAPHKH